VRYTFSMRINLLIAFLGFWVALIPFLPIQRGSTQTLLLSMAGLAIAVLALWSLRESTSG